MKLSTVRSSHFDNSLNLILVLQTRTTSPLALLRPSQMTWMSPGVPIRFGRAMCGSILKRRPFLSQVCSAQVTIRALLIGSQYLSLTLFASIDTSWHRLVNAMALVFDTDLHTTYIARARLQGPLTFLNADAQETGMMLGATKDTFAKISVFYDATAGIVVQFVLEQQTRAAAPSYSVLANVGSINTIDFIIAANPETASLVPMYIINDGQPTPILSAGSVRVRGTVRFHPYLAREAHPSPQIHILACSLVHEVVCLSLQATRALNRMLSRPPSNQWQSNLLAHPQP